jgi:crotonobetainyl-CoA:carnitine CoA-transferase CaiB-like acyl-CoA transferase
MAGQDRAPLTGIRVVDSSDERGELCGRILADLGADVVRVEPPGGAPSRRLPPFAPDGTGLRFAVRNTNKRSVTLDLDTDEGRSGLDRLLATADAWIESDGTGAAEAADRHPRLVVTSVTDFGLSGPYRHYVGTDDVLVGMGGLLFRSGTPDRPPLLPPGSLAYDAASVTAAFATLAGLWQRRRTGRGQHVDLAVLTAVAQISDWALANWSAMAKAGNPYVQSRAGSGFVYPLYPCADGYVRLVVLSKRQWRAMRAWLGEPDVVQDETFDQLFPRMAVQEDILDPLYIELFSHYTAAELAAEAQRRGIVMTPVTKPHEVLTTPHFAERGSFVDAEAARGVRGPVVSGFMEIDGVRAGYRHRAPDPGEHNADVLASDLARSEPDLPPERNAAAPAAPFAGLKVLDFGHGGVGVEAGRMLADYGADVVKIESRTYPDFIRTVMGSDTSPSFASSNRGKRSFGVDLKHPEGLEAVRGLVRWADVVIENNSTGTMADLGLDHDRLKALNPGIVMVSSQLMGSSGPWKDWIGYGPSTRPAGGMTHLWNFPDGGMPPGAGIIHPDHLVGRMCAVGAVAALLARDGNDGQGAHVEVAQVETVLGLLADLFLREALVPGSVGPEGNGKSRGAPWGVYPCAGGDEDADRWCVVTVRHDDDWRVLRGALGDPDWARRPDLDTAAGRIAARAEIDEHLAAWTRTRTDREVTETLQAAGVPAGFMAYPEDMTTDPHYLARGFPQDLDQPGVGPITLEGPAFVATGMVGPRAAPAPALGEHTRDICRDVLGLDDAAVDALVAGGALEEPGQSERPPVAVGETRT